MKLQTAGGNQLPTLWEDHSDTMSDNETDPTKMTICPFHERPLFREKDLLIISLKAVGSDTIELADSKIRIPVTMWDSRAKVEQTKNLTKHDFAEVDGGTDGIAFVAGVEADFAKFEVPSGMKMLLGQRNPINSRIMISPYDDT